MPDTPLSQEIEWDTHSDDDIPSSPAGQPTIADVIDARFSRRDVLRGLTASALFAAAGGVTGAGTFSQALASSGSTLTFKELPHSYDETHHVAEGYAVQTLLRWGDPLVAGAPEFDPMNQTAAAQSQQWGYNNDYVGYFPLPQGANTPDHGLLCVNFEYTNPHLMFPGVGKGEIDKLTREQIDIEMAAHGHGVVEIERDGETWKVVKDSPLNRRISALDTEMKIAGPVAGHDRLKTNDDPTGTKVIGTINNCAGGETPWGTVIFAEENFHGYFGGDPEKTAEARNYKRYGLSGKPYYAWHKFHDRFNLDKDPNQPNKYGWMVEVDPYDPNSVPVKRTALGRFKHEGATVVVNKDGRIVVYSGDDQRFDYIYKFVSTGRYDPNDRAANSALLDDGTLHVAKFEEGGRLVWMPLVFGQGPLTAANDFHSQADVLIETRRAADLLGATPMDRPEDVEPNPATGVIYVNLTNNTKRKDDDLNPVNPRAKNKHGHVIEMIPPGTAIDGKAADADHAAREYSWSIFLLAGNPKDPKDGAQYHPDVTENGWLSCPDNMAFDKRGRIWIATDGAPKSGFADGVWAADCSGPGRALTRHFYHTPLGAELCGPCFNADDTAYFAAVQHPADVKGSTFDTPATRWPDFDATLPPRPALQVVVKKGGGAIGA